MNMLSDGLRFARIPALAVTGQLAFPDRMRLERELATWSQLRRKRRLFMRAFVKRGEAFLSEITAEACLTLWRAKGEWRRVRKNSELIFRRSDPLRS